jgi:hypothetical protein
VPSEDVPPHDVAPGSVAVLTPRQINVTSWSPEPLSANVPATQVFLLIQAEELPMKLGIRFRGPDTLDEVIDALQKHREYVWGSRA